MEAPKIFSPELIKYYTLPEPILFLPDYFALDEQECKERCDHVVEGSDFSHNVVVLEVSIGGHWELRCREFYP